MPLKAGIDGDFHRIIIVGHVIEPSTYSCVLVSILRILKAPHL